MTLISPYVAEALKLEVLEESIHIRTGLGARASAPLRVAYLHIVLGAISIRMKVGVVDMPSPDGDIEAVIGMDFIMQGSFAISYDYGQLMFSFCYPPTPVPIDFTEMLPALGFSPSIVICDAADNEDPELTTDAEINAIRTKFSNFVTSRRR